MSVFHQQNINPTVSFPATRSSKLQKRTSEVLPQAGQPPSPYATQDLQRRLQVRNHLNNEDHLHPPVVDLQAQALLPEQAPVACQETADPHLPKVTGADLVRLQVQACHNRAVCRCTRLAPADQDQRRAGLYAATRTRTQADSPRRQVDLVDSCRRLAQRVLVLGACLLQGGLPWLRRLQ